MIHPIRFLYRAHHGTLPPAGDRVCWLCGGSTSHNAEPLKVVRSTYADAARERHGGGDSVCCEACDWYYEYKIVRDEKSRPMGFFTKSVLVHADKWVEWLRPAMLQDILRWQRDGLPSDSILCLNYSKQGHAIPTARVLPAGARELVISTELGLVGVPSEFLELTAAIAWLWERKHAKGLIAEGRATPSALRASEDPGVDMDLLRFVSRWSGSPVMDLATYVVTEEERSDHSRHVEGFLQRIRRVPAAGSVAAGDRERGGVPGIQIALQEAVVADGGGTRSSREPDRKQSGRVEQSSLF